MGPVRDTVAGILRYTSGTNGGDRNSAAWMGYVNGWGAEGLERELGHLFNTGFWVGEALLLAGIAAVAPDLLHVLPLGDIGYLRIRMPLLLWALSPM